MYSKVNYARLMQVSQNRENEVVAKFYAFTSDSEIWINVTNQVKMEKIPISDCGIISKLLFYSYMKSKFRLIKDTKGEFTIKDLKVILA